jgi:hypothetical protein
MQCDDALEFGGCGGPITAPVRIQTQPEALVYFTRLRDRTKRLRIGRARRRRLRIRLRRRDGGAGCDEK